MFDNASTTCNAFDVYDKIYNAEWCDNRNTRSLLAVELSPVGRLVAPFHVAMSFL